MNRRAVLSGLLCLGLAAVVAPAGEAAGPPPASSATLTPLPPPRPPGPPEQGGWREEARALIGSDRLVWTLPRWRPAPGKNENPAFEGTEIWTSDLRGRKGRRLAFLAGARVAAVEPSPRGDRLACVTLPPGDVSYGVNGWSRPDAADDSATRRRLYVLDAGRPTDKPAAPLVPGGADSPCWTPDGRALLFFRHGADGWRAVRSTPTGEAITPLGSRAEPSPGVLSPDGSRYAVLRDDELFLARTATGAGEPVRVRYKDEDGGNNSDPEPLLVSRYHALRWSPNGRWLYATGAGGLVPGAVPQWTLLLDTEAAGLVGVPLGDRLGGMTPPKPEERIDTGAFAEWVSVGKGKQGAMPRLLVHARRVYAPGGCMVDLSALQNPVREDRWLLFDPATGDTRPVDFRDDRAAWGIGGDPRRAPADPGRGPLVLAPTEGLMSARPHRLTP